MPSKTLVNPHLEGGPFLWEGGADGSAIADRATGRVDGVLLVHGLTATTAEVRPLGKYLHEHGYTISGPLLPGHYTEPADLNRVRWQDWAATVEAAYDELCRKCRRVAVGGESTGAVLTLYLAARRPDIAALLAFAPAIELRATRRDRVRLRLLAPFLPWVPKGAGRPSEADALWQGYPVNPLKGVRELLRLQKVVRPLLPRIRQPILIMQGRLDGTVSSRAPQDVYDGVSSAVKELVWLEHSTHCVAIDCERNEVFERTRFFLERAFN